MTQNVPGRRWNETQQNGTAENRTIHSRVVKRYAFFYRRSHFCTPISDPWFQKRDQFSSLIQQIWYSLIPYPPSPPPKKCWSRSMVCDPRSHPSDPRSHPFWSLIPHTSLRPCSFPRYRRFFGTTPVHSGVQWRPEWQRLVVTEVSYRTSKAETDEVKAGALPAFVSKRNFCTGICMNTGMLSMATYTYTRTQKLLFLHGILKIMPLFVKVGLEKYALKRYKTSLKLYIYC